MRLRSLRARSKTRAVDDNARRASKITPKKCAPQKKIRSSGLSSAAPGLYPPRILRQLMLVRQRIQSLASCVAGNERDDARSLSTHHTVIHRAIRLGASGRGDGCRGSQELVRNRAGTASARRRDKLVAALTRTSRGTVV